MGGDDAKPFSGFLMLFVPTTLTFSEMLCLIADNWENVRTGEKQNSFVASRWVCMSRCLGSVLGCFPDLKVTQPFGSKGDK